MVGLSGWLSIIVSQGVKLTVDEFDTVNGAFPRLGILFIAGFRFLVLLLEVIGSDLAFSVSLVTFRILLLFFDGWIDRSLASCALCGVSCLELKWQFWRY